MECEVHDRSKVVGGAQRIESSDQYVIPLSIESGLVYMQSIKIPTDSDLKQYPHVFFTSPDTWDASVLDHGITHSLHEEINQESDDSLFQDSISMARQGGVTEFQPKRAVSILNPNG